MSPEHDEHFLHVHHGLEALTRPVVHNARRLAFGPGDAVYGVDEEGILQKVHPALGTEALGEVGPVRSMGGDRRRLALVGADGVLRWRDRSGAAAGEAPHPFPGAVEAHVSGERTLLVGDTPDGRQLLIWTGTKKTLRVQLPEGADVRPEGEDTLLYWASDAGLESMRLSEGGRFRGRVPAPFRLIATPGPILGLGADGLVVFGEGEPSLIRETGITCVDTTPDGEIVLVGTEEGEVLVVRHGAEAHPARLQAHDGPVYDIAVDRKGTIVATASANLVLWGLDP